MKHGRFHQQEMVTILNCLVVWKCLEHLDYFPHIGNNSPNQWYRHGVTIPEMGTLPAMTGWAARNVRGLPQDRDMAPRGFSCLLPSRVESKKGWKMVKAYGTSLTNPSNPGMPKGIKRAILGWHPVLIGDEMNRTSEFRDVLRFKKWHLQVMRKWDQVCW